MIERWLDPILRPFRELRSKWNGIKNVQDNIMGDAKRVKAMAAKAKKDAEDLKKKGKEAADKGKALAAKGQEAAGKAKEAAEKAKGAYGNALGQVGQMKGQAGQAMGGMAGMMGGGGGAPGAMGQMGGPPGMGMPQGGGMMGGPPAAGGFGAPATGFAQPGMNPMPGMGGPPQQSNRTMAILAGGGSQAALGWLVPLKGPQRGQLIQLKLQSVIGKDPGCDVVINDAFLSSRHATIKVQNGVFMLEDHSTNGTFVNDRKVARHELVDSDFIKVGQTLMKFKAL